MHKEQLICPDHILKDKLQLMHVQPQREKVSHEFKVLLLPVLVSLCVCYF